MGAPSWPSQVGNDVHVPAAVGWSKFFKEDLPVDREGQILGGGDDTSTPSSDSGVLSW